MHVAVWNDLATRGPATCMITVARARPRAFPLPGRDVDSTLTNLRAGRDSSWPACFVSHQKLGNHSRPGHVRIGETVVAALMRKGEAVVVQPQGVEQRCMQIADADNVLHGAVAEFVRFAVDVASLEPAAGQPQREGMAIVIAAIGPLRDRETTEFSGPEYDR